MFAFSCVHYVSSVKIRQKMKQKKYQVRNLAIHSWFGESFHYWPGGALDIKVYASTETVKIQGAIPLDLPTTARTSA